MAITVQQFDFIAEVQGYPAAFAAAEEAGGVTGTRTEPGTQIEIASPGSPFAGGSKSRLTSGGGQYIPGTVVTDTSQAIGAAGSDLSGQTLNRPGGGGVATGDQIASLAEIMLQENPYVDSTLVNAPVAPAAAPTPAEALMARANAGEILTVADIATLDPVNDKEQLLAIVDQVLGNLVGQLTDASGAGDQGGVKTAYKNIFDLWQNFYQPGGGRPGQADIVMLMNTIANRRGFGENLFAGLERALETGGEEFEVKGAQMAGGMDTINQGIKDYILSYAGQTDDWTKALRAASQIAYDSQGEQGWTDFANNHGVPTFGSPDEAYAYFSDFWETRRGEDPTYWNEALGTEDKLATGQMTAADQTGDGTTQGPFATVIPQTGQEGFGELTAAGVGAENRGFGQVFPGFLSTSGYADIPNVGGAIAAAQPFLSQQYGMVAPLIPQTEIPAGESRAGNWLRGLTTGDTSLLRGNPLAARLQKIAADLGQPAAGSIGALGEGAAVNPFRGAYFDPNTAASAAQVGAVMNPFILATRGAPTSRSLALNAIQKAATDFNYLYPSGVPTTDETTTEQFLPWALRTNLMGIRDLPEFQGVNWGNF